MLTSLLELLICPDCGEMVDIEEGEGGTLTYFCEECYKAVDPVREPPPEPHRGARRDAI